MIPEPNESLMIDVIKIACSYDHIPDCYIRDFEHLQNTLEYILGESDSWGDAADDFKVTVTIEKMDETEFNNLDEWEDFL